jgi:putative DNA primase/helicase
MKRFKMEDDGLYKKNSDEDKPPMWVCGPFQIEAETWDEDLRRWGVMLLWVDRSGKTISEVFPRALFSGDCSELRGRLADGGLTLNAIPAARQALAEYLNLISTSARARAVSRTGWHRVNGARAFVLPDAVFGKTPERIVLQAATRDASVFGQGGSLEDWQRSVAILCVGNSRLVFAVSVAFAGPLLELTGEDGGGIHYRGPSRGGKTTGLRVAASVWGGALGGGASEFIKTWRATGNGLEGTAAVHSDTLLCLDEMGQTDPREVGAICYMLGNGQGKTRSDRSGGSRAAARFRVLFLSTGEVGLSEKGAEGGQRIQAGQEVRLVDVPADTERHGLFDYLHDADSAGSFADELREATRNYYGTAGRAYLQELIKKLAGSPEFPLELRGEVEKQVRKWLEDHPEAGGQVRSVARRFALISVAGELASSMGVTQWAAGEAQRAASTMFEAWLADRGTIGSREDAQAVAQLRGFMSRYRESRFERWDERRPQDGMQAEQDEAPPAHRYAVQNSAGWRRWERSPEGIGVWRYLLTQEAMIEALAGLDVKAAVKAIVKAGYLRRDSQGKSTVSVRPPGVPKKIRLFEVSASILGAGYDQEKDTDTSTQSTEASGED